MRSNLQEKCDHRSGRLRLLPARQGAKVQDLALAGPLMNLFLTTKVGLIQS